MTADPLVGSVLDNRYEIQARIGEGGMGVVYRARQLSIDRVIALKVLAPEMAKDPTWVQRFYNEAKACSRLQHPNTIRIFDFGQTSEGRLFMTMEFLDGISLRDALAPGPMPAPRVAKVLIQACASLAEAHTLGIVHRDIKPDNVFLLNLAGSADFVKLLDFSVAKLAAENASMKTQAGVVFGTPQYMSPEQGRGAPLDARSDLYALGVLAFEMLTGNVPFNDDNPMVVIQMHLRTAAPPMPQSIPYPMQQIVLRALEKDPARRYQNAGEMMAHCQQVFAELSGGGPSVGAGGAPKTMIAGAQAPPPGYGAPPPGYGPPAALAPGQLPPAAAPPGFVGRNSDGPTVVPGQAAMRADAAQKTVVAGHVPAAVQAQLQAQAQAHLAQLGQPRAPAAASPMQKTMMAQAQVPIPSGPPQGAGAQEPPRTVMLQSTDGVVSIAARGPVPPAVAEIAGASLAFWIVSLLLGIGGGILAYIVYRQL